ncbi:TAXI family TRAP transporter solute-binding subunit [Sulfitobacter aestuarii]|uniref:TAXI family TRAP transporter solute-binding subunit n=1 Tax=Sulfitobacter aestuarii TaxID=2161676 RepID=A0ABW5U488_9RHOB
MTLIGILKRTFGALSGLLLLFAAQAAPLQAQEFEKNIMTGGPSGTYIQIGRNLSEVARSCDLTLNVVESAGSLENFLAVRNRRNTQFGIVQSDVLEYLRTFASDDPDVARAILGVRMAFPLYNEEVHILARKDITDLKGLAGKRVAIGTENSGTYLTASLVLDLAQINPAERVTINANDSLEALLAGQIDAFFYVAGAPASLFQSDRIDPAEYHLLGIDEPTLQAVYVPAQIEAGTYPFQQEAVDLVAVKAVLMTYEYQTARNNYHRTSCKAVSDIAYLLTSRFSRLQESGHPKWKQVDLADLPPGWDISACVNTGLAPDYSLTCRSDDTLGVEVDSLESEANAAYRAQICKVMGC